MSETGAGISCWLFRLCMFPVELAFRVAGLVYDEAGGDPMKRPRNSSERNTDVVYDM